MTNPLVAERQDSTTAISGIGIAESAVDLYSGVSSGSWVEGGLGLVGGGLEALSLALDPVGTLVGYGVAWLMEHVKPLSDALDWLAGDGDTIASYAQTWRNVSQAISQARTDFDTAVSTDTAAWTGAAADTYRTQAAAQSEQLTAAATSADTVGTVVEVVGVLVGVVREVVRDLVADCVATLIARIPQWLAEIAATLGIATPHVVASAIALISKWVNRISDVITKLVRSINNLTPLLRRLDEIWEAVRSGLRGLTPGGPSTPNAPTTTPGGSSAAPNPGAVDTPTVTPNGTTPASAPAATTGPVSATPTVTPDGPTAAGTTPAGASSPTSATPTVTGGATPGATPGGVSPTVTTTTPAPTVAPGAPTGPPAGPAATTPLTPDEFDQLPVDQQLQVAQSEVDTGAVSFANDADAVQYGQQHWNDYVDNLPPEQRQALFDYTMEPPHTQPTYQEINGALRGNQPLTPEVQAHIDNIDAALAGNPLSENVVITRGTGLGHIGMDPQDMVGQTFTEDAYLSTSLGGPAPAFDSKEAVLHLQVPAGTPALWVENVSAFGAGERELLLGRGLQYQVDRVVFEGGQWHVYGQYLPVR